MIDNSFNQLSWRGGSGGTHVFIYLEQSVTDSDSGIEHLPLKESTDDEQEYVRRFIKYFNSVIYFTLN